MRLLRVLAIKLATAVPPFAAAAAAAAAATAAASVRKASELLGSVEEAPLAEDGSPLDVAPPEGCDEEAPLPPARREEEKADEEAGEESWV